MAIAFEILTADIPGESLIFGTSGGEGGCEEGRSFGAFEAAAECVEDAAVHVALISHLAMASFAIIEFRVGISSQAATNPAVAAVSHVAMASVEAEPIGKMQVDGLANDFEMRVAQFEETFQKNDAQSFLAEKFFCLRGFQLGLEKVPRMDGHEMSGFGDFRKLEKIERALDGIESEEA